MSDALAILRVGMSCAIGLDAAQTAASLRAGVSRKTESELLDAGGAPIVLGHLAEDLLAPLDPRVRGKVAPESLEARLLRLAGRPLREVLSRQFEGLILPVYLAGPAPFPGEPAPISPGFAEQLATQAKVEIDGQSRVVASGGAGLFGALTAARDELLVPGRAKFAIVGAVDSHVDARRLAALERDDRLRTRGPQDAFTPGEGAAFMIVATEAVCRSHSLAPLAWITAISTAAQTDQRPRGEALAHACACVLAPMREPIRLVMAGLNGEHEPAREWGVATLRNREHLAGSIRVEHPAELIGDAGAALAPIMIAGAALHLRARLLDGPALVWARCDTGQRGALVLYAGG